MWRARLAYSRSIVIHFNTWCYIVFDDCKHIGPNNLSRLILYIINWLSPYCLTVDLYPADKTLSRNIIEYSKHHLATPPLAHLLLKVKMLSYFPAWLHINTTQLTVYCILFYRARGFYAPRPARKTILTSCRGGSVHPLLTTAPLLKTGSPEPTI